MRFYFCIIVFFLISSCQPIRKTYQVNNFELIAYTNGYYQISVKKGYSLLPTYRPNKVKLYSVDTVDNKVNYIFQPLLPGRVQFEVFKNEKSREKINVMILEKPDPIVFLTGRNSNDSTITLNLKHMRDYILKADHENHIPITILYSIREFKLKYDSTVVVMKSNSIRLKPEDYKELLSKKEKYFELYDFKVKGAFDTLTLKDHFKVHYTSEGMSEEDLECLVKEKQSIYLGTKEIAHDKKDVEVLKDPEKCQQLVVTLEGTQNYIYIFDESGKRIVSEAIYSDGPTRINISDFSGTYRLEFGGDIGDTYRFNLIVK